MKIVTRFFIIFLIIGAIALTGNFMGKNDLNELSQKMDQFRTIEVSFLIKLANIKTYGFKIISSSSEQALLLGQRIISNPGNSGQNINISLENAISEEQDELDAANNLLNEEFQLVKSLQEKHYPSLKEPVATLEKAIEQLLLDYNSLITAVKLNDADLFEVKEGFEISEEIFVNAIENNINLFQELLTKQTNVILKAEKRTQIYLSSSGFFIVTSLLLLVYFFRRWISVPLNTLVSAVNSVREGHYDINIHIGGRSELATLAQAFSRMTQEIKQSIADRNKSLTAERLRADQLSTANQRLKGMQQTLIQSSKLASIGELASGVGHELNNPLFVVINAAEQMRLFNKDDNMVKYLDMIDSHCDRMEVIVNHLRKFSKKSTEQLTKIDVNQVIESSFTLISQQLLLRNINLEKVYDDRQPKILGDANMLEQVLINLLNNARDALEENAPHKDHLSICVSSKMEDDQVVITVADNGPGIPDHLKEKIYDAFFSTKELGKGTGLGLSISHAIIVEQHHGQIDCQSTLGLGTTFTITLPLINEGSTD